MDVYIPKEKITEIYSLLDTVVRILAFAEGEQARYEAQRDNFRLIQFPAKQEKTAFLEFTAKELQNMPKFFRKIYKLKGGKAAHIRQRQNGSYEIRFRRNGINLSISAKQLQNAKQRFIRKLNEYEPEKKSVPQIPKRFDEFALYWFENFHKRKVAKETYERNLATYRRNIQREFEHLKLTEIIPVQIQNFLDGYEEKKRTKETLHSLLHQIFDCAVKHGIISITQDVPEKNDELYPFLTINDRINKKKKNSPDKDKAAFDECREIWEDIVSLFDKLSEWYRDNDLYHQIGFLIAYETPGKDRNKDSINVIDDLIRSTDGCRKSECNKAILNKIRQNFKAVKIDDLEYETSSKDRLKIKNVLLCFNIFTMIESKAKTRFSFNQYKSQMWDVEHVHARATESELNSIGQEKEIELLKALAEQIGRIGDIARQGDAQDNIDKIEKYIQVIDSPSVPFVDFYNEINDYYDNCSGNGIGNLVLLDAKTNRSYHNALFAEKRQKIIDRDKGGVFIPVCTRNVFLKVYSGKEGLGNMFQWTSKDAEKYVEEIKRVFGEAKII